MKSVINPLCKVIIGSTLLQEMIIRNHSIQLFKKILILSSSGYSVFLCYFLRSTFGFGITHTLRRHSKYDRLESTASGRD